MAQLGFSEAFAFYGATLTNPQWAVSAIADDGALVLSCWTHYITKQGDALVYRDRLSRWTCNAAGNSLLRRHLLDAVEHDRPVRYLTARADDTRAVDDGEGASRVKKVFAVKPDLVGRIARFDGDEVVIEFRRA